jgi:hypothetical protein
VSLASVSLFRLLEGASWAETRGICGRRVARGLSHGAWGLACKAGVARGDAIHWLGAGQGAGGRARLSPHRLAGSFRELAPLGQRLARRAVSQGSLSGCMGFSCRVVRTS